MEFEAIKGLFDRYVIGNYARAPIAIARAQGSEVWDTTGKRYLDLLPGLGCSGVGHCHPHVVAAVQAQAAQLLHFHNNYYWEAQGRLAELVAKYTAIGGKTFFANSGTEASEGALKLARLCAPAERRTIVTALNSFHGRSYGALSATAGDNFHMGVEPILPGFRYVPLNDLPALEKAFAAKDVAAVYLEPVQGEGGIFPCTGDYLRGARKLCDQHGALLMFDEIQSGGGRCGRFCAGQVIAPDVKPDVVTYAKSLGGGLPIGAVHAREGVHQKLAPGTHGSTFGANVVCCAAAIAVFEVIERENLFANVTAMAEHLKTVLAGWQKELDCVKEVRQVGLMVGIDLAFPGKAVIDESLQQGLLINCTHNITLRLLPAMNVTTGQLNEGLGILKQAILKVRAAQAQTAGKA
ncbi:MAG: aspartate aminotransferase family protein [Planctomycetota bacterium]